MVTEKLVLGNQHRLNLFLGRLEQGQFCNFMKSGKKSLCIFKILQNHETLKGTKIELHVSVKIELSMEFWLFGHFEPGETPTVVASAKAFNHAPCLQDSTVDDVDWSESMSHGLRLFGVDVGCCCPYAWVVG